MREGETGEEKEQGDDPPLVDTLAVKTVSDPVRLGEESPLLIHSGHFTTYLLPNYFKNTKNQQLSLIRQ